MNRPAHHDLVIALGAVEPTTFSYFEPGDAVAVSTLVPGDIVYVSAGVGLLLHAAEAGHRAGQLKLRFGAGLFDDPVLYAEATDLARKAKPATMTACRAAMTVPGRAVPGTVDLACTLTPDGHKVTVDVPTALQAELQQLIDWQAAGPNGVVGSWDMIVTVAGAQHRIVEGIAIVIRSTAAAAVPQPTP